MSIELVADLPGHAGPAWCVAWNPMRPLLASCSSDKTVRLYAYDFKQGPSAQDFSLSFRFLSEIPTAHKRTIRSIAWSPNGRSLATGSFDSTVGIWEEVDEFEGIEGVVRDGETSLEREWECVTTLEGHESECKSVGWSADGQLLASCSRDKSVWIWELQADGDFECISVMMEHTQDVKSIAWHPTEELLASASYDASIYLFADDPDSDWSPFQKLNPSLPVSKAQRHAAKTAGPESADLAFTIPPLQEPETVWSVAFSPCGNYLASGGDGGGIRIWERSGTQIDSRWLERVHVDAHQTRACFGLSWAESQDTPASSAAGCIGRLTSAGGDGQICVWEIRKVDGGTDAAQATIEMHVLAHEQQAHTIFDVNAVAMFRRSPTESNAGAAARPNAEHLESASRSVFATAGDDGCIKVWRYIESSRQSVF